MSDDTASSSKIGPGGSNLRGVQWDHGTIAVLHEGSRVDTGIWDRPHLGTGDSHAGSENQKLPH